jgi:hypothetical protein
MSDGGIQNAADCSSLGNSFRRFNSIMSLATSHESEKSRSSSSSSAPADIRFQSNSGSYLIADQQASNIVQIVYKKPLPAQVQTGGFEAIAKDSRRISSFPIQMASFSLNICVKDLNHNDVACVELCLSKPGSSASNRFVLNLYFVQFSLFTTDLTWCRCSLQLYASGLLLRDGIWVGHLPQFANKQAVIISVLQTGAVFFSVNQKVILELNVEFGSICQLAVSFGGEGNSSIGPPIADGKEMFIIHMYHSPIQSANFLNTVVQRAIQKQFKSLSDRLHFASFACSLSSILLPSDVKLRSTDFSLIQVISFCHFKCSQQFSLTFFFFCSVPRTNRFSIYFVSTAFLVYHAYLKKIVSCMLSESFATGYQSNPIFSKIHFLVSSSPFSQVHLLPRFLHP